MATRDIRVPEFTINAGGAALTAGSAPFDDIWKLRLPNNLDLNDDHRLRGSFDDARATVEELAEILDEAETAYQDLRDRTGERLAAVFVRAHERHEAQRTCSEGCPV